MADKRSGCCSGFQSLNRSFGAGYGERPKDFR